MLTFLGATTLAMMTLGIMTHSIKALYVTININDTELNQHSALKGSG